jgi:hypothetical protein
MDVFGISSLVPITFLGEVESFGDYCFPNCRNLQSVQIPSPVRSIPSPVRSIPQSCSEKCYSLVSITFLEEVESFGEKCFSSCTSLKSIEIPISIKKFLLNVLHIALHLNLILFWVNLNFFPGTVS